MTLQEEMQAKREASALRRERQRLLYRVPAQPAHGQGFSASQPLHYTFEPDPELPLGDSPAPRERLVFAFSTADVVVFGARLSFLVDLLRDHKLTAVWPLAERYSNLEPSQPFVSGITIRLLCDKSDQSSGAEG